MPMGLGIGLSLDFGGKVGSLLPTAPAGANYAFLSHPSYWASDASHLVPCAAGDAIRWWKDAVTGTWYEQATSGLRFIARKDATGKWYAEGDGTKQHQWLDLSSASGTNATFAAAFRQYSAANYAMLISSYNGVGALRELRNFSTTLTLESSISNNTAVVRDPSATSINTDYRFITTMGGGGSTTTLYRNGSSVASSADTQTGNMSNITIVGNRTGASFNINGRFYGLLIAKSNAINVATWDTALHSYCTA